MLSLAGKSVVLNKPNQSLLSPCLFHLVLSGHRAAEEGGEEVGQEVQVDEHEGGVRPSLLRRLAQPLHSPRPWQGGPLPVHCVEGWWLPILRPHWLEAELSLSRLSTSISLCDISGCFTSTRFFSFRRLWFFCSSCLPCVSLCGAGETVALLKHLKLKETAALDGRRPQTEHCFLHADWFFFYFFSFLLYVWSFPHLKLNNVNSDPSSPECRSRFVFTVNRQHRHDVSSVTEHHSWSALDQCWSGASYHLFLLLRLNVTVQRRVEMKQRWCYPPPPILPAVASGAATEQTGNVKLGDLVCKLALILERCFQYNFFFWCSQLRHIKDDHVNYGGTILSALQ